jgi:hypothetical protein
MRATSRAQQPDMPVIGHLDSGRTKPRKEQYPTSEKPIETPDLLRVKTHSKSNIRRNSLIAHCTASIQTVGGNRLMFVCKSIPANRDCVEAIIALQSVTYGLCDPPHTWSAVRQGSIRTCLVAPRLRGADRPVIRCRFASPSLCVAMEIDVPAMPSRLLRISTEMLPERERFSALQEEFAQKILKMDLIDRGGRCPRIEVAFVPLGAVAAGAINCTSAEFIRRNHHLKDCSDDFRLPFQSCVPPALRRRAGGTSCGGQTEAEMMPTPRRMRCSIGRCRRRQIRFRLLEKITVGGSRSSPKFPLHHSH